MHVGFNTDTTWLGGTLMLELVTCAQFVPSHDISMTTVAVPVPEACMTNAGAPRALIVSVVGPVVVAGDGAKGAPTAQLFVAACAGRANRKKASTNFAFPLRIFRIVSPLSSGGSGSLCPAARAFDILIAVSCRSAAARVGCTPSVRPDSLLWRT